MPLTTQVKMLRAAREILLGDGRYSLAGGGEAKPDFLPDAAGQKLPCATPEEMGIASEVLQELYQDMAALPLANAHSLCVARHGHVVSEGYFSPYRGDIWHVSHSLCKTFVGTAVGFAVSEGLFQLEDSVASYFPQEAGILISRRHRAITVRNLLCMQSGITFNEVTQGLDAGWVKGIFSSPMAFEPGEQFAYNSMNSYLLTALVCKQSGQTLMEYLTPRLFQPLGFGPIAWEKSPEGIEKGGWGMYIMPQDMAKFGQLYLQDGMWADKTGEKRILPEGWVREATTWHTDTDTPMGYGYHLWIDAENNTYSMNGMFGQYITVFPKADMVVTMTGGSPRLFADSPAYTLFTSRLSPSVLAPQALPQNPASYSQLRQTLAGLCFGAACPRVGTTPLRPAVRGTRQQRWNTAFGQYHTPVPPQFEAFCGPGWTFGRNRGGILPIVIQTMDNLFSTGVRTIRFEQKDGRCLLHWEEGRGALALGFGFEHAQESRLHVGRESFAVAAKGAMLQNEDGVDVLRIDLYFLEHSSYRILKFQLQEQNLIMRMDEQPQFLLALEAAMRQEENTGAATGGRTLEDMLKSNEYLNYRLLQFCSPQLVAAPVASPSEEGEEN